jgi:hypothetical protein
MREIEGERRVRRAWLYLLLIGILCVLTYARGLPNLFVAEDFSTLAFSSQGFDQIWKLAFTATRVRPLSLFLGWLLYQVFGAVPVGHHLFTLVFHVANCMGVFSLGNRLSKNERVGLVASLLFSVYPRHHQSVLWLAACQYVMIGTFVLASLLCFDRFLQTRRIWFQVGAVVCVCLAVATNEGGLVALPLMFLLDVSSWNHRQQGWRNLLRINTYLKYIPYLIFLVIYLAGTFGGSRLYKLNPAYGVPQAPSEGWKSDTYHLTVGTSWVKDLVAYLTYLMYPQIPLRSLDVGLMAGALSILALLFLLFLLVRGQAAARFTVLWMGLTLVPFVLFVPFGNADRYFYMAAIGYSLLGGLLGCWAYDRIRARSKAVAQVASALVVGAYLVSSVALMQQRINEYRRAGEIVADIVEQAKQLVPSVPAESTMLFAGLPDQYGQAYVFLGGGIGGAIYLAYGGQPSSPVAYQTRDLQVAAFLRESRPVDKSLPGLYVFLYGADGTLRDKTDVVGSLGPLRESTWYR